MDLETEVKLRFSNHKEPGAATAPLVLVCKQINALESHSFLSKHFRNLLWVS